jgi:pilus assembly protein CpaB
MITPRILVRLTGRKVPARFVPPDSLRATREALGLRALVRVPRGSYVGASQLGPPERGVDPRLEAGQAARLVEVPVSGATTAGDLVQPGARVDVLITSERGTGSPRTYLALQRVELAGLRTLQADGARSEDDPGPDAIAALRVTLRQAVLLTAAQNFARELRLVPRPRGDDRSFPATAVAAGDLHP